MKKAALLLATVATLAAAVSAPAEARGLRHRGAGLATAAAVAVAATVAAEAYGYGPGYGYYGAPGYYGSPVYYGGWRRF
jgi:hypothetical protein